MKEAFFLQATKPWGELSSLEKPGFYWINCDRKLDADFLCLQAISALPETARAALICSGEHPKELTAHHTPIYIKRLPMFRLSDKQKAYEQLPLELNGTFTTNDRLYILTSHASNWISFGKKWMNTWIKNVSNWLLEEQSTLLILTYGTGAHSVFELLQHQHRLLYGLGWMQWTGEYWSYHVPWWANQNAITANQVLYLNKDGTEWTIDSYQTQPEYTDFHYDETHVYLEQQVLNIPVPSKEHWHVMENNKLIAESSNVLKAATLIFALYSDDQIEELLLQVSHARNHCGNRLKIVVKEMSNNLRFSDQQALLTAGANLIIPYHIHPARMLNMIESIQGQVYNRKPPKDILAWFQSVSPIPFKGYLPLEDFVRLVTDRIEHCLLPENAKGILVSLKPVVSINTSQALSICHSHRLGDIATANEQLIFLFLSDCNLGDLETALNFIFRISIKDVFIRYDAWENDMAILKELKTIVKSKKIIIPDQELIFEEEEQQEALPSIKRRHEPTPITLTAESLKE